MKIFKTDNLAAITGAVLQQLNLFVLERYMKHWDGLLGIVDFFWFLDF
jgi:hypothetical protein